MYTPVERRRRLAINFNNTSKLSALLVLNLEVTARCNLHCTHCFVSANNFNKSAELSTPDLINTLKDFRKLGTLALSITGGEPFVREDIFDILTAGTKIFKKVYLTTNGTLLNKLAIKKLKQLGIHMPAVSLDGVKKETHEFQRGKGTFDRATNALKLFAKYDMEPIVCWTINKANQAELFDLPDFCKKLGVTHIRINPLILTGRAKENEDQFLSLREQFEIKKRFIEKYRAAKDFEFVFAFNPCFFQMYDVYMSKIKGVAITPFVKAFFSCLTGVTNCTLTADGSMLFCPINRKPLGNIRTACVKDVWQSAKCETARRQKYTKCSSCRYGDVCFNGCPFMPINCPHNPPEYLDDAAFAFPYKYFEKNKISAPVDCEAKLILGKSCAIRRESWGGLIYDFKADEFVTLNKSGFRILQDLEKPITSKELTSKICLRYDVSPDKASSDLQSFLGELLSEKIIEYC